MRHRSGIQTTNKREAVLCCAKSELGGFPLAPHPFEVSVGTRASHGSAFSIGMCVHELKGCFAAPPASNRSRPRDLADDLSRVSSLGSKRKHGAQKGVQSPQDMPLRHNVCLGYTVASEGAAWTLAVLAASNSLPELWTFDFLGLDHFGDKSKVCFVLANHSIGRGLKPKVLWAPM